MNCFVNQLALDPSVESEGILEIFVFFFSQVILVSSFNYKIILHFLHKLAALSPSALWIWAAPGVSFEQQQQADEATWTVMRWAPEVWLGP